MPVGIGLAGDHNGVADKVVLNVDRERRALALGAMLTLGVVLPYTPSS